MWSLVMTSDGKWELEHETKLPNLTQGLFQFQFCCAAKWKVFVFYREYLKGCEGLIRFLYNSN